MHVSWDFVGLKNAVQRVLRVIKVRRPRWFWGGPAPLWVSVLPKVDLSNRFSPPLRSFHQQPYLSCPVQRQESQLS